MSDTKKYGINIFLLTTVCAFVILFLINGTFSIGVNRHIKTEVCPDQPAKWIDPDNFMVVYMVPEGCNLSTIPLDWTVPSYYSKEIFTDYYQKAGLPPIDSLPKDWYISVLPDPKMD